MDTADDAGVYRLTDELALVQTADYITPPVDDPYLFGQIAATNAISDIYAMGAKPMTALNLVGFPSTQLAPEVLQQIVEGALSKITEAGATLVGGHSTDDEEPKFGLAVTGTVHPDKIWRNSTARVGDHLVLTKPIGSGVLFNANRKGWVSEAAMEACLGYLTILNKAAAEVLGEFDVHACTDVTGFGLAGHSFEAARPANVTFAIELSRVPLMDEALAMYKRGMNTGSNRNNRLLVEHSLRFERELPAWHQEIVFDPQTAGGLLVALPPEQAERAVEALRARGCVDATLIGEVRRAEAEHVVFY